MDEAHVDELAWADEALWWQAAKRALVASRLRSWAPPPGRLVDAGSGPGGALAAWAELGYEAVGLDASPRAVALAARCGRPVRRADLEAAWPVEPGVRAVVLLDALEHLAAPAAALRRAAEVLRTDGAIVVTVPAVPALFGPWDRKLGHLRRYTAARLRREAREAGLAVAWLSAWNLVGLPLAAPVRLAERAADALGLVDRGAPPAFPRLPRSLDRALGAAARGERWVLERHALPVGLSLAAVLRPEGAAA